MRLTIAQTEPKLGDISHNAKMILDFYHRAEGEIVLFPELSLTGYTVRDAMLVPHFISACEKKMIEIMKEIGEKICVMGLPFYENGHLFNAMIAIKQGQVIAKSTKTHFPIGGVFDENRYFSSGEAAIFEHNKIKFGLPICEDIWHEDICLVLKNRGADCFLVGNASPFYIGKHAKRLQNAKKRYEETQLPVMYCNQVLNQDGILYDGSSFCYDGRNIVQAPTFTDCLVEIELVGGIVSGKSVVREGDMGLIYKACVFGLNRYVRGAGFNKVLVGLSGGADSALVASLAVSAFGVKNVCTVFMPSEFTSAESFEDAMLLAENLGVDMRVIPIEKPIRIFGEILKLTGTAAENIQSRIRGNILMGLSNQMNAMVLTTGNKSEIATGYCTIYGDMCGGYNPIKDLYKFQVLEMMRYINGAGIAVIPERIITKEPTAELRYNQKDSDFLPPYRVLDGILVELIENRRMPDEIRGFDSKVVAKVFKLLKNSEYKRRQSAPGTKISKQSFEQSDWRWNVI